MANCTRCNLRIDRSTPSTGKCHSSTPERFHLTDSAYCTSPSELTHPTTPHNLLLAPDYNFDNENGEMDPKALSAAFGGGDRILKHSTAKKSTKPATQRPTKKR